MDVRKELMIFVKRNARKPSATEAYKAFSRQERSDTVSLKVPLSTTAVNLATLKPRHKKHMQRCCVCLQYSCLYPVRKICKGSRAYQVHNEHHIHAEISLLMHAPEVKITLSSCRPRDWHWLLTIWIAQDALESVVDLKEADVPYHVRFCIDRDIRCGHWYTVIAKVRSRIWDISFSGHASATMHQLCHHGKDNAVYFFRKICLIALFADVLMPECKIQQLCD